jgi:hypothetical protein
MNTPHKTSLSTVVLDDRQRYRHFGIMPSLVSLYGVKVEDILNVEMSVADDQTLPPSIQNDPNANEADYWGWWDFKQESFTMIYGKRFLLDMCFPAGIKATEEAGQGKAYRLNVKLK